MAKTSKIARNQRRMRLAEHYRAQRKELKEIIRSPSSTEEAREEAYARLRALPRDSNPNRIRKRCLVTGRPRGNYRKFGICRVTFREMALEGQIPGVRKASW